MRILCCLPLVMVACSKPGLSVADGLVAADAGSSANTKSFSLASFTLGPGDEKIMCYYVPPDGQDHMISRFTVDMNAGSHHLIVFRVVDSGMPASGPTPCTQLDVPSGFDGMLPGSQQQHFDYTLPDGVAMKLAKNHGLYFQSHYINASSSATITTAVTYQFGTIDPALVTQTAGVIFDSNFALNIPVGMSTASKSCATPQDLMLLTATGHMHKHGLTFDADVAGTPIYHTDSWDDPGATIFPTPGHAVTKGQAINFSCAYNNDTGMPLVFGNSAVTNEMCIFSALYYPASDSATLFCL